MSKQPGAQFPAGKLYLNHRGRVGILKREARPHTHATIAIKRCTLCGIMRIFFALELAPETKLEISSWRDRSFRDLAAGGVARPVNPGNFHITLAFTGDVAVQRLERLCDSVDQLLEKNPLGPGSFTISEIGYWQRQGILWLGPKHCPGQLSQLANRLEGLGTRFGGKRSSRAFQPHITLFRGCKWAPQPPLEPPEFSLDYSDFVLLESTRGKRGVSYHALQSWRLNRC